MKKSEEVDPLADCERILSEKKGAFAESIRRLNQTTDEGALAEAVGAFRSWYDFGARMVRITGRNLYQPRWTDLNGALTEKQQRLLAGLKHRGTLPAGVAVGDQELNALARLEEATPAKSSPNFFNGSEADWQKYLADRGLVEADYDDSYTSRSSKSEYSANDDPNHEKYGFRWTN